MRHPPLIFVNRHESWHRMLVDAEALALSWAMSTVAERLMNSGSRLLYKVEILNGMQLVPSSFNLDLCCFWTRQKQSIGFGLSQLWLDTVVKGHCELPPRCRLTDTPPAAA